MTTSEQTVYVEDGHLFYKGTPVKEMLAFPLPVACRLMGIGKSSLYALIASGRLKKTSLGTIPKEELLRFLMEDCE